MQGRQHITLQLSIPLSKSEHFLPKDFFLLKLFIFM